MFGPIDQEDRSALGGEDPGKEASGETGPDDDDIVATGHGIGRLFEGPGD
jgi:hypothetical protein